LIVENIKSKSKFIQIMQQISYSKWFSTLTVSIIIIYAGVLGFKTMEEAQETEYGTFIFYLDYFVTIYFVIEIIIRISAYENKLDFFKDKWNIFDFSIVLITTVPIEQTEFATIARVMRVFRVLRLVTARPELKKIIDMLINAIPSIIDIVLLMFIIFYIYAVVGSFIFADMKSGLFDNFLTAMLTLFRVLTFEDWTDIMYEAMETHQWAWIYFISFIVIAGFVFFNLFVAVIIGEMQEMRENEKKESEEYKLKLRQAEQTTKQKEDFLNTQIEKLQKDNQNMIILLENLYKEIQLIKK
jgi:voltage-gated sodium channel